MSDKFYIERYDWAKRFPGLLKHDEFNFKKCKRKDEYARYESEVFDSIARYVIFLNDEKSPLGGERQTRKSKITAMDEAHVPKSFREELFDGENKMAIEMTVRFLRYQNNHKMSELLSKRELFYMIVKELSTPIDGDVGDDRQTRAYQTRMKMSQDMGNLRASIEQLESELFGNDTGLAKEILDKEENTLTTGAAEEYAVTSISDL